MEITGKIDEVRKQVKEWRQQGLSIGLVPTMGYLHEGHKSLIDRAAAENDRVVVSDFVNPIQFGVNEDLATYPRDIEADKELCSQAGADLIFHPQPEEMYAPDFSTYVEMQKVSERLCGKTHSFSRSLYSGVQAVSYCDAGQSLFRPEGCTAAGGYPADGP